MPPLLSVIFTILIGWPLLKLLATIVGRGRWERQREIRSALEGDLRYGELERRIVADKFEEGKGSLGQMALPFVAFFGGWALLLGYRRFDANESTASREAGDLRRKLLQISYPAATPITFELLCDDRYEALDRGAFELSMLRYPVATIATGLAILPSLTLLAILHGLRSSVRHAAGRLLESSRQTVKMFSTLIATVNVP